MHSKVQFLGKNLLFLIAHPDDETLLAAGAIYENYKKRGRACIVCATTGERGKAHLQKNVTIRKLSEIRKKELIKVSKLARVNDLHILRFPDTKLSSHRQKLKIAFLSYIKKYQPDYIVSFGKDGVSGHLDHITCWQVASDLSKETKIPLITFCATPALTKERWLQKRRFYGKYIDKIKHPRPEIKIKINPKIKLRCFAIHKSQNLLKDMPEKALKNVLNYEFFAAVRPQP